MKGEIKMNNSKEIQTNDSDNLINFLINLVITYGRITEETKNTLKLTFGRYPKTIINSNFKKTLEEKYLSKTMNETGNTYTFPVNQYTILTYKEYEYKNRLFIRIEDKQKNIFWVEVGEVNWTINLRKNLLSLEKDTFTLFSLINQSMSKEEFITNFFLEDLLQSSRNDIKIKFLNQIKERKIREKQKKQIKKRSRKKEITYFSNKDENTENFSNVDTEKQIKKENRSLDKSYIDNQKEKIEFEDNNSSINMQNTTNLAQNNTLDYEEEIPLTTSEIENNNQEEIEEVQEGINNAYLDTTAIEEENTENFSTVDVEEPIKAENQSLDKSYIDNQKEKIEFEDIISILWQNTTNLAQNNTLDYEEEIPLNASEIENNNQEEIEEVQEGINNTYLDTTTIEEENTEDFVNVDTEKQIKEENQSLDKSYIDNQKEKIEFEDNNSSINMQNTTTLAQNNTLDYEEEIPLTTSEIEDNSQKESEEVQEYVDNNYLDTTALEEENTDDFYLADWNTNFLRSNFDEQEFYFDFLSAAQAKKLLCRKQGMMSAAVTPFAVLRGAKYFQNDGDLFGYYWTKDSSTNFSKYPITLATIIVNPSNELDVLVADAGGIGGRPLLVFDDFCNFLKKSHFRVNDDESSIYLGCYPQEIVSSEWQEILEHNYQNDDLSLTGKNYYCFGQNVEEYQYQNRRFIRARIDSTQRLFRLRSDFLERYIDNWSETYHNKLWIEVKPVKWIILNDRMLLCEKILFSSPFSKNPFYHDFEESGIYRLMNDDLKEVLFQDSVLLEEENREKSEKEELRKFKKLLIDSMEDLDFLKKLKKIIDSTNDDKEIVNKNVKVKKRERNLTEY